MANVGDPSCSVSAAYVTANAGKFAQMGQTEAQLAKAKAQGAWGVYKGLYDTLPNSLLFKGTYRSKLSNSDVPYEISKLDGKLNLKNMNTGVEQEISKQALDTYLTSDKWDIYLPKDVPTVPSKSASVGNMRDEDVAAMFVKVKDEIAKAKGINIKGANPQLDAEVYKAIGGQIGYTAAEAKAKVDAYKASGKKLSTLKKKTVAKTAPSPNGVPLKPTVEAVEDAVEELKVSLPTYLDEDVAKAYIKAKDQLAASPDNPWTLYTQNNADFDAAIYKLMDQSYGIDLAPGRIKAQIASYLGDGNKLSVLKKKMTKTGEYEPVADTLKKKKGDPTGTGKTSKTQAQKDIQDAAAAGHHPGTPYVFSEGAKDEVFLAFKNDLYAGMSNDNVYDKFKAYLSKSYPDTFTGKKPSMLDLVRVYDEKKAAQLGIDNGNFYEKKIAEFAASPAGRAKILAEKQADELLKNLPPLPADSAGFNEISTTAAKSMLDRLAPWTPREKDGLRTYTGGSYREMNQSLRNGREKSSSLYSTIQAAQDGMRAVDMKFLVHRGCDFQQFGFRSFEESLQLIGKTVQDKGFLSTSVGGRAAFSGSVNLEIEIPTGTFGAYLKPISNFSSENEFLVAAGTKYEVLTVKKTGYQTTIRIRAIPGSHTKGI